MNAAQRALGGLVAVAMAGIAAAALLGRLGGPEAVVLPGADGRPVERRYNVLLVVVDTLRADHVGPFGGRGTPNLDALAASSRVFPDATAQAPWTSPSIASMMTSRPPRSLGIQRDDTVLPQAALTLAEVLHTAGWVTGGVVSHSFCGRDWGFAQGFDTFDESNVLGHLGVSSPGVTERALAFLDAHQDERFFLWVHYFDPHYAYQLHPDHDPDPASTYAGPVAPGMPVAELERLAPDLGPADWAQVRRLYGSEVGFTDAALGRVLDRLDALGLRDDTLVVFAADHGEEFGEHGRFGHAHTVYQELVHVPLLVRCPGWPTGEIAAPVANVDVFPTVLACLGLPPLPGLTGVPLGPDAPAPDRPVFSQTSKRGEKVAVRVGDHKLVAKLARKEPAFELYDLRADPGERHDLAPAGGPVFERLSALAVDWHARTVDEALPAETIDVDAWLKENLAALGYVDEDE